HTRLFAQARDGSVCRFRTAYPVDLWPLEIVDAGLYQRTAFQALDARRDVSAVLRVRIEARGTPFSDLELETLRLHLHGEPTLTGALYDLLGASLAGIVLVADEASPAVFLPEDALVPVGFAPDEDAIP